MLLRCKRYDFAWVVCNFCNLIKFLIINFIFVQIAILHNERFAREVCKSLKSGSRLDAVLILDFKSAHLSAGNTFWSVSFSFQIHGPQKRSFRLCQTATLVQNLKNLIRFLTVLKGSKRAFRVRGVHTLKNDALAYAKCLCLSFACMKY
jgi:hypothetical protein